MSEGGEKGAFAGTRTLPNRIVSKKASTG